MIRKDTKRSGSSGKGDWRKRFLAAMSKMPNVTKACIAARITTGRAYQVYRDDNEFKKAWDEAALEGVERLEAEAWRRANNGVSKGVWMRGPKGKPLKVETVKAYSDTLMIFLLKAHKPDKYHENVRTQITGADGGPVAIQPLVIHCIPPDKLPKPAPLPPEEETGA